MAAVSSVSQEAPESEGQTQRLQTVESASPPTPEAATATLRSSTSKAWRLRRCNGESRKEGLPANPQLPTPSGEGASASRTLETQSTFQTHSLVSGQRHPSSPGLPCRYYLQGRCLKGASCTFLHFTPQKPRSGAGRKRFLQGQWRPRQHTPQNSLPAEEEGGKASSCTPEREAGKGDASDKLQRPTAEASTEDAEFASSSAKDKHQLCTRRGGKGGFGAGPRESRGVFEEGARRGTPADRGSPPRPSQNNLKETRPRQFPSLQSSLPAVVLDLEKIQRLHARSFQWKFCEEPLKSVIEKRLATQRRGCFSSSPSPKEGWPSLSESPPLCQGDDSSPEESTAVCAFRLVLVPSDPSFDSSMLPDGLAVEVAFTRRYAEASLKAAFQPLSGKEGAGSSEASAATGIPTPTHAPTPCPRGELKEMAELAEKGLVAKLKVVDDRLSDGLKKRVVLVFENAIAALAKRELQQGASEAARKTNSLLRPTPFVFTALKALDRRLLEVFSQSETQTPPSAPPAPVPWSLPEQRRLEEAIVFFRRIPDVPLRWRKIGEYVGSRSARECALRFQQCREQVVEKLRGQETADERRSAGDAKRLCCGEQSGEGEVTSPSVGPSAETPPNGSSGGAGEEKSNNFRGPRGVPVALLSATLEGVAAFHLSVLSVQVSCSRCHSTADVRLAFPLEGETLEAAGCSTECIRCKLRLGLQAAPLIAHASEGAADVRVALIEPRECAVKDFLPSDFSLTCFSCGGSLKLRQVHSGGKQTHACRHCHAKVTFGFEAASLGVAVVAGRRQTENQTPTESLPRRKKETAPAIRVGTPLSDLGTCKHYKKSFRWLRFPCCGKTMALNSQKAFSQAYPCDVCHDLAEDHDHEWATRMICGFCSLEQPFAVEKVCVCGKALTKGGGTCHWESTPILT